MADATWEGDVSGDYSTGGNWDTNAVPGTGDTATFDNTASVFSLTFSASALVGGWAFNSGAYDFTVGSGKFVSFDDAGIAIASGASAAIDNSGIVEFDTSSTAGDASITNNASMTFRATSTAGTAILTNHLTLYFIGSSTADTATITNDGILKFWEDSTAGAADITNDGSFEFVGGSNAGGATIISNNTLSFSETATASNATITNNATLLFKDTSSAESADITNNTTLQFSNSSSAGSADITNSSTLQFVNDSTAGSATITTANGATTNFNGNSTGGDAKLINNTGGTVDFSGTTGLAGNNKVTAGSIEGAGSYFLGANELAVGGNDLSTEVGGAIQDGGAGGGTGASLVKVGTGTLVLSGAATYTGGTTINAGTLQAEGNISASTTVNNGGTLSGDGITGAVTVNAGGTLSPGSSAGSLDTGTIVLAAGAILAVDLGGTVAGIGYDQLEVTGTVNLGGATLDGAFINAFDPSTTVATDFIIIDNDDVDAVTGTFTGLAEGAKFVMGGRFFKISYAGGTGNDVVLTSGGALINGTAGNDVIDGTTAPPGEHASTGLDDLLIGGLGQDDLTGGLGSDTFDYNDLYKGGNESLKGANRDAIFGFNGVKIIDGELDLIDLSSVDARKGAGNQAFHYIGAHAFHDRAGELQVKYNATTHIAIVSGDIDGNGKADFQIEVHSLAALAKADFLL